MHTIICVEAEQQHDYFLDCRVLILTSIRVCVCVSPSLCVTGGGKEDYHIQNGSRDGAE